MKVKGSLTRARITFFFKETFRAHSKSEYREVFTRGIGEDKRGITGSMPWLYVRAFFVLFILFTVNVLILRFTENPFYVPTVTLFGGVTFSIPLFVLLYELYPKRDLNVFKLFSLLVIGGTAAGILVQLGFSLIDSVNGWSKVILSGVTEEVAKAAVALCAIVIMKNKNAYACFLIGVSVGAGFSIIEDMGYIFYYSDMSTSQFIDIRNTVYLFLDRGLSSLCTHILWTGIIGWAYAFFNSRYNAITLLFMVYSTGLHILWNLPLDGWMSVTGRVLSALLTLATNVAVISKSQFSTLADEFDITRLNDEIMQEATKLSERMRFTNAANLTFALTCTLLSAIMLALCCLPIGIDKTTVRYENCDEFVTALQGGYNLTADWGRKYDPDCKNAEVRYLDGETTPSYVIQETQIQGFDGTYFFDYYMSDPDRPYSISVELDEIPMRIPCVEYKFGDTSRWIFEVNDFHGYTFNQNDGSVSAVTDAESFEGYDLLIALVSAAVGVAGGCAVILVSFTIKLRRAKNE